MVRRGRRTGGWLYAGRDGYAAAPCEEMEGMDAFGMWSSQPAKAVGRGSSNISLIDRTNN